jgi:hypothetical protein
LSATFVIDRSACGRTETQALLTLFSGCGSLSPESSDETVARLQKDVPGAAVVRLTEYVTVKSWPDASVLSWQRITPSIAVHGGAGVPMNDPNSTPSGSWSETTTLLAMSGPPLWAVTA